MPLNELKLDRSLLDKDFEGYKLSLTPIPVYKQEIPNGVDVVEPSEDQYSFLHQRLFSLHNHLTADPWNLSSVYFVDSTKRIYRSWIGESGRLEKFVEVLQLPNAQRERQENTYNISLVFSSPDTCVLSDGGGSLLVVDTSDRSSGDIVAWKVIYDGQPLGSEVAFSILDSKAKPNQLVKEIHCVVQYITPLTSAPPPPNKKTPGFETVLVGVSIVEEVNGEWTVKTEELRGPGAVDYVAVEASCEGIYVISEATFKSQNDSQSPNGLEPAIEDQTFDFEWQQTYDCLTVRLALPENVEHSKSDVEVKCESTKLNVRFKGESLLSGTMAGAVDPSLTTWNLKENLLEITMQKYLEGAMWQAFIESDKRGKEVADPNLVEETNERLAHLTSDKEEQANVLLNAMEECDVGDEESRTLQRFAFNGFQCTNKVYLGSQQWLLTGSKEADQLAPFCIRNDVDGCIWSPGELNVDTGEWKINHVGTLLAFGYVQASKTNRKFSILPPDFSYVAIVDVSGHVIIYRKGVAVNSTLRNRRTGRQLKEVAVQQMVNLQMSNSIVGAVANNEHIFVLTRDALHLLHVV